jgi:hypothetical protein
MKLFRVFLFRAKKQTPLKMVPMGFELGRIHLLLYQWDVWPQSPRELFYFPLFLGPEQSPKGFSLNNSPTDHYFLKIVTRGKRKWGFKKSWSKRNSYVRSHIYVF